MKIEKISETMLKVTLCLADMLKWNISYDNLLPNDPDTNEMFWDIIHRATEETGMEFENCRLIIEAMQADKDTYVLYITKKSLEEKPKQKSLKYKYYKKQRTRKESESVLVYSFAGLEDIVAFAKNNLYYCFLFDGKNSLYRDHSELKLVITIPAELKEYAAAFNNLISEYANIHHGSYLYASYLDEHSKPLIRKNALKTIFYKM